MTNVDPREIDKFSALADSWWDPEGPSRPLHDLNPVRLGFVTQHADLKDKEIVDVGCGGGILSEAMADEGGNVLGADLADASLEVARAHARDAGVAVQYRCVSAEELAAEAAQGYDIVTCMEMLEHVPDPDSVVDACATLTRPGGWVFFSTLNRTLTAFALGIVGAEYVLGLLPRGTHTYRQFIRPSELAAAARTHGLALRSLKGIQYNPFSRAASLVRSPKVNYIAAFQKESA